MEGLPVVLLVAVLSGEFRRVLMSPFRQFSCIGPSTIYRMSLSFLVLFFLMMVFMLCKSRLSMVVNEGLFCVKYIMVLAIFIAFLFVKTDTFEQYSIASKYISILFMIIQVVFLPFSLLSSSTCSTSRVLS